MGKKQTMEQDTHHSRINYFPLRKSHWPDAASGRRSNKCQCWNAGAKQCYEGVTRVWIKHPNLSLIPVRARGILIQIGT